MFNFARCSSSTSLSGQNGVGKTTFADRYLPEKVKQLEFVSPDLIAHENEN